MSAFDTKDDQVTPTTEEEIESYVAALVESKGEQWKDPEVIAKGKWEADRYINELKAKYEKLQEDLSKASQIDELIAQLKSQTKSPEDGGDSRTIPDDPAVQTEPKGASEDEIRALVEAKIAERESASQREKNVTQVDSELVRRFGDSANAVIRKQAAELDMTVDEVKELAATKPKAFFRLMGLDDDHTKSSSKVVGAGVRSEASFTGGPTRNWAYYQELRRKDKAKYYSQRVQDQMYRDKEALGDKFGLPT